MGFAEQLQEIIARLPDCHQTVLFSATLPKLLVEFARAGEELGAGTRHSPAARLSPALGKPSWINAVPSGCPQQDTP